MTFYWWGPWDGQTRALWTAILAPVALAAVVAAGTAVVRWLGRRQG